MKSCGSLGGISGACMLLLSLESMLGWFALGEVYRGHAAAQASERNSLEIRGSNGGVEIRQTGPNTFSLGRIEFDKREHTVSVPAKVRLRSEVVEYALVTEQGKGYESMFTTEARPTDIHLAFLLLGVNPVAVGGATGHEAQVPQTNAVAIDVNWETDGRAVKWPLASLVLLTSGRPDPAAPAMKTEKWLYNGSMLGTNGFAAQREGSIISLIRDPIALVNNPGPDRDNDEIHFPNAKLLPPEGTPVRVVFRMFKRL